MTDQEFDLDPILEVARPTRPDRLAEEARSARQRIETEWEQSRRTAESLIDAAGKRFVRAERFVPDGRARVVAGLAPMVLYANEHLGNGRPQTLLGLAYTLEADIADKAVVSESGDVTASSTLYRVIDHFITCKEHGAPAPDAHFTRFLDDPNLAAVWPVLRAAVGGRPVGSAPGGSSEYSSLNFEVPSTPASYRPLAEVLAEVGALTGMTSIKGVLGDLAAAESVARMRREVGLQGASPSRHMLFTGNPGTGKTTVARLVADVLKATGSMPDAHLVEADRSMLIGEWLGSSALKTRKVADAALGGVLFIDEAYSLAGNGDGPGDRFAQEALDTLVKVMEDDRDDLVVILAGYPEPMERLRQMNPGLASRIGITVAFPDFTGDELLSVFEALAAAGQYDIAEDALGPIDTAVRGAERTERFGNARFVRSLFESCTRAHAVRLMQQHPEAAAADLAVELRTLRLADTAAASRGRQ